MNKLRNLALAAAFLGLTAAPAQADFMATNVCGGGNFTTCTSVDLSSATVSGNTVITVMVTNLGSGVPGEEGVFARVALVSSLNGLPSATATSYPTNWSPGASALSDFDPITGASAGAPPTGTGIQQGASGTFVFTFDGELNADQLASLGVAIHSISGVDGCSTKLAVFDGSVVNGQWDDDTCPGPTTVPEPTSAMILLGAGLVGLAASRRRNGIES